MPTHQRHGLLSWALGCFGPAAKACSHGSRTLTPPRIEASTRTNPNHAIHGSQQACVAVSVVGTLPSGNTPAGQGLTTRQVPTSVHTLVVEELDSNLFASAERQRLPELPVEHHLDETALFIESMISDMMAMAHAVISLDTAASWETEEYEETKEYVQARKAAEVERNGGVTKEHDTRSGLARLSASPNDECKQTTLELLLAAKSDAERRATDALARCPSGSCGAHSSDPCLETRANSRLQLGDNLHGLPISVGDSNGVNALSGEACLTAGTAPCVPRCTLINLSKRTSAPAWPFRLTACRSPSSYPNPCPSPTIRDRTPVAPMGIHIHQQQVPAYLADGWEGTAGLAADPVGGDGDGIRGTLSASTPRKPTPFQAAREGRSCHGDGPRVFSLEQQRPEPWKEDCGGGSAGSSAVDGANGAAGALRAEGSDNTWTSHNATRPAGCDLGGGGDKPLARRMVPAKNTSGGQPPVLSDLPVMLPSLAALLADVSDLSSLATAGPLGRVWQGTWRGLRVAVKLVSCPNHDAVGASLTAAVRASRLRHANLATVYDIRAAHVDERALLELDPAPTLRSSWRAARRPVGRLQRFLVAHAQLPKISDAAEGLPSLTIQPGDMLVQQPNTSPALHALLSLRPHLGSTIVATIMEFYEKDTLHSLSCGADSPFRASRSWSLHVAQRALLRTAREVASGMRALHAEGITHLALRPSNVLLAPATADRRGFVARVTDVGSGSLLYAASNPLVSGNCMVLLAPEALTGEAAADSPAMDVYAFGMLLYVMAAGEMPFERRHLVPVLMAVASEGLRPEWPMGQHDHLEPLFRRCVAQRPAERPTFKQVVVEICSLEQRIKEAKRTNLLHVPVAPTIGTDTPAASPTAAAASTPAAGVDP